MSAAADALLARMGDAERRIVEHSAAPVPSGLTEPDPGGEERWEAGQVWAHVAEFPSYWLGQIERVIQLSANQPVPFGRVKTDAGRIGAIERDRHQSPETLLARARDGLARTTDTARALSSEEWQLRGIHPTLGEMTVLRMIERFIVAHLEEHADQLDQLAGRATPGR